MRSSVLKIFFTCIILVIAVIQELSTVIAQTPNFYFEHITVKNGLSTNRVSNVLQDSEGFYWIATVDGLNRFDGSSFKIFRNKRDDTTTLAHNFCAQILEGDDGDIWVATLHGVSRYQKKKGKFKNYFFFHPAINDNIMNSVSALAKDDKGNIWASSYGLWRINPVTNRITGFVHDQNNTASISDPKTVFNLTFDSINKGLWMRTDSAINFFDIRTEIFFHHRHNPFQWPVFMLKDKRPLFAVSLDCFWVYDRKSKLLFPFNNIAKAPPLIALSFSHAISNFSTDAEGNPFFSFELVPAIIYNRQQQKTEILPNPGINSGINFSGVAQRIYRDHHKNIWLSTQEGTYIIKHDANLLQSFFLGTDISGFPHSVGSFVKVKNNLWIQISHRLFKYSLTQQKLLLVKEFKDKSVMVLHNSADSLLWLAQDNEILLIDLNTIRVVAKTLLGGSPYFAFTDKQNNIWLGTWDDGLYKLNDKAEIINHYSKENGLKDKYLLCGRYDGKDEIWLGMNGGRGFARLKISTGEIENYLISSLQKNTIEFNTINCILNDSAGNLWLGTYGGGLYYFSRSNNHFQNYNRNEGLSGENINTLAFDSIGNLWISTANGIDIMDLQTKNIRHISEPMQQINNDHNNNLAVADDGTLFYAAHNKFIAVNPRQYTTAAAESRILIGGFNVSGKEFPPITTGMPIDLSYRQNFFSFEFSALKVSPDIPAQYKYKLEGFNKDWVYSNSRGLANFTNVPPGEYTLLLNVTNETGKWNNKPLELSIIIKPPFWRTGWFYLLSVLLIASAVLLVVKNRVKQFKKRQQNQLRLIVATQENEKKNIAAELHDDLGVRLSALKYFVTSLRKYMQPNDAQAQEIYKKTITTIDESVEDVRYLLINLSPKTLDEYGYLIAVEDLVNKLSQLHIINISLNQKGMEKRLNPDMEAGLYRITQELINNALKHAGANSILLNIENTKDSIQLHYADDGKGFNLQKTGKGYGIENIHTRVALLNGKIEWDTGNNKPTKVNIVIPYNHTKV